jgi:hypothetical protein
VSSTTTVFTRSKSQLMILRDLKKMSDRVWVAGFAS